MIQFNRHVVGEDHKLGWIVDLDSIRSHHSTQQDWIQVDELNTPLHPRKFNSKFTPEK